MKGLAPLFLGVFGTFMFSWIGLTVVPNVQLGHLEPQSLEEDTDIYPLPQSGMVERGRQIYNANGCIYCHSRWVRADYAGSDLERKWGDRRSAPRDYLFERPVLLGKMRTGPDLSNVGQRAPLEDDNAAAAASPSPAAAGSPGAAAAAPQGAASSPPATVTSAAGQPPTSPAASPAVAAAGSNAPAGSPAAPAAAAPNAQAPSASSSLGSEHRPDEAPMYSAPWHHKHLYSPRSITIDSIMPAYRFLYEKRPVTGEPSADALKLTGKDAPPEGWEIVPTYDAKCLVAFLISSNQSHPLNEVKAGGGAAAAPAASPAASPVAPAK
jgi:cbb3-type cytochrome oxidase cytochrome c subunit